MPRIPSPIGRPAGGLTPMTEFVVASIAEEQPDSTGATIVTVFSKVVPVYAVYRTHSRVMVQFADDPALGAEQRQSLAPINPLRGRLNGTLDEWRNGRNEKRAQRAARFDRRIADALTMALQGHGDQAEQLLLGIEQDLTNERTSTARFQYLIWASLAALATIILITVTTNRLNGGLFDASSWRLWYAAGIGTIGALFSIAIGIRNRSIVAELISRDNIADACLRVLIGAVGAAVLMAFILSGAITFTVGGATVGPGAINPYLIICTAFIAGFLERLVPDMLGQAGFAEAKSTATRPAPAAIVAPAAASEHDPLGKRTKLVAAVAGAADAESDSDADVDTSVDGDGDHCDGSSEMDDIDATSDVELPEADGGVVAAAPVQPVTA